MGLDMYAYAFKKLSEDRANEISKLHTLDEFPKDIFYMLVSKDAFENDSMYRDLDDMMDHTEVEERFYSEKRMRDLYSIPENWYVSGTEHDNAGNFEVWYTNPTENEEKHIRIEAGDERCIEKIPCSVYFCQYRNLGYWRKNNELDEKLEELYGNEFENCGFYCMNDAMLAAADISPESIADDEKAFYHLWC
ncbi:MAG: hypothetical protein Q4B26_00890 [Eubacteriales bacterium]|nr:hypothetical protein [Eubacteriales bacterium]